MAINPAELSQGAEQPTGQQSQGTAPQQTQEPAYSELASSFLKEVPEQQRGLLEPHLKKWDAGVTKKFQEIHGQYAPYKELGADPETLAAAYQLYQALDNNPQQIYEILKQEFEGQVTAPGQITGQGTPGIQQTQGEETDFEIPPGLQSRLDQMEGIITQLGQLYLADKQQTTEQQEQAQFEKYLGDLREQFGDFDEEWVTLQISKGMDGEEAVQAWNKKVSSGNGTGQQTQQAPAPTVLGGGGAVPAEELDVTKLDSKDTRGLVAGLLRQTAEEGG